MHGRLTLYNNFRSTKYGDKYESQNPAILHHHLQIYFTVKLSAAKKLIVPLHQNASHRQPKCSVIINRNFLVH